MATSGPDFVSFQVRDKDVSARFYEDLLGMTRIAVPNPHAYAFSDGATTFAVRDPLPGFDPAAGELGAGIAVWFRNPDAERVHERAVAADAPIVQEPVVGPFGFTFAVRDPDGYVVTIHERA